MPARLNDHLAHLRQQVLQLDDAYTRGALDDHEHGQRRARLERAIVAEVLGAPAQASRSARLAALPWQGLGWLALALGVGGAVLAIALQQRAAPLPMPAVSAPATDELSRAHSLAPQDGDRVAERLVERLAARLAQQPADADGWAMLARTQAMRGEHAQAVQAFGKAVALRSDDAMLLADYADALAMTQQQSLAGEPIRLVRRALQIDPRNLKALSLAGTEAFDRQDMAGALTHWQRLVELAGADHVLARQIQGGIVQARQHAAAPAAVGVVDAAPAAVGVMAAASAAAGPWPATGR